MFYDSTYTFDTLYVAAFTDPACRCTSIYLAVASNLVKQGHLGVLWEARRPQHLCMHDHLCQFASDPPPLLKRARAQDLPLTVLVNRRSASASEILAGALRDNCRAVVAGGPTFGKGLIQSVYELADGSGLAVTVGKYLTPAGAAASLPPRPGLLAVGCCPRRRSFPTSDLRSFLIRGRFVVGKGHMDAYVCIACSQAMGSSLQPRTVDLDRRPESAGAAAVQHAAHCALASHSCTSLPM